MAFEAQDEYYIAKILAPSGVELAVGAPIMITVEDKASIGSFSSYTSSVVIAPAPVVIAPVVAVAAATAVVASSVTPAAVTAAPMKSAPVAPSVSASARCLYDTIYPKTAGVS